MAKAKAKGQMIGFIGGGKMGSVLIHGIVTQEIAKATDIIVADVDRARLEELKGAYGVCTTISAKEAAEKANILILAVKPQNMADVLDAIAGAVTPSTLIISIAAGIPIAFIEKRFKKGVRIIRTMPNTPALAGEGMAALAPGGAASSDDLAMAQRIFNAVGLSVIVKEDLMDAVTGLSGSGPAYGFVIIEALADGGVQMGLPRDIAVKLAAQTILGAAKLVLMGDKHTGQLKDMVTSPGGTTIAGIRALEDGKLRGSLMAAVEAATLRSKALGSK
ncbi:MAG: Pyrroline-5-carboxylate reductase [Syntrophus sp. SKADARSKE-3]|nr:Pyrroline-5-carboxylate reductase [Syntrophus sp. SKADARSKE-3]